MTTRSKLTLIPRASVLLLCAGLGGCFGNGGGDQVGEALQLGLGAATLGLAVAGVMPSGSSPPTYRSGGSGGYVAPSGNGYSQKGAFDDCARLYGSVGARQQEAECRRRSANMGSLR